MRMGHPVFKSITASSRGMLKQKKGRSTIHFNGDSIDTELLCQTIHFVNQLNVHGAVANWCHQFGWTEEEEGRANLSVDNKTLTSVQPEEVQILVSPPTMAPGSRMRENVLSFEALASRIHLTQLWEKAYFQNSVIARKKYKIQPDADDGWGTITPTCQEYNFLDPFLNPKWLQLLPKAQPLDQFWRFELWKFWTSKG